MKLLPVLILTICVLLLAERQGRIWSLTGEIEERSRNSPVAAAPSSRDHLPAPGNPDPRSSGRNPANPVEISDEELVRTVEKLARMVRTAEKLARTTQSASAVAAIVKPIDDLLRNLSQDEITAFFRRLRLLELADGPRRDLQRVMLWKLASLHPGLAIDLAASTPSFDLNAAADLHDRAFSNWIKEAPEKALAWLDQQITEEAFESKTIESSHRARLMLERSAIEHVLATNQEAAIARLDALPSEFREQIFAMSPALVHKSENDSGCARLVRESVPEDRRELTFQRLGSLLYHLGGYDRVGEFSAATAANDTERYAMVLQVAREQFCRMGTRNEPISTEVLASLRTFVSTQSPGSVARIQGIALSAYAGPSFAVSKTRFEEAVEHVRDLHRTSPDDEILVGFLENRIPPGAEVAARELANLIQDPEKRDAISNKLGNPTP